LPGKDNFGVVTPAAVSGGGVFSHLALPSVAGAVSGNTAEKSFTNSRRV
jgi:hypothetical protein